MQIIFEKNKVYLGGNITLSKTMEIKRHIKDLASKGFRHIVIHTCTMNSISTMLIGFILTLGLEGGIAIEFSTRNSIVTRILTTLNKQKSWVITQCPGVGCLFESKYARNAS